MYPYVKLVRKTGFLGVNERIITIAKDGGTHGYHFLHRHKVIWTNTKSKTKNQLWQKKNKLIQH